MPLPRELTDRLAAEVVNELAILEDRAIRAEGALERSRERAVELEGQVASMRDEVDLLRTLAEELQQATKTLVEEAARQHVNIEKELRRLLVLQAS
jgi:hypothetical protein